MFETLEPSNLEISVLVVIAAVIATYWDEIKSVFKR